LLVFPTENISPLKILKFIEKYSDQLTNFRKNIEKFLKEIEEDPKKRQKNNQNVH